MNNVFSKAFIGFEVIFSIALTNIILVVGSVLSAFLLFPILLIATLYALRRMYTNKEYTGILVNYFRIIKGNILPSIKLLYPLVLFIVLIILSVFYYNQILFQIVPPFFVYFVYVVQAFLLYQAIGVLLVSAILYGKKQKQTIKYYLNHAFIIFNAHPVKGLLAMISLIMGIVVVIWVIPYAYLLVFPISLFMFYVVFSDVIENEKYA